MRSNQNEDEKAEISQSNDEDNSRSATAQPNSLPELHNEILINIFSYLPYTDLTQVRLVCRLWMDVVTCKRFSNRFCLRVKEDNLLDIWRQLQTTEHFASGMMYRHIVYMGVNSIHTQKLQFILQSIGPHARNLKLKALFEPHDLYLCFPNLERLILEDLYNFPTQMPFELNAFGNLKAIHFVDDSMEQSSSEALLAACLRKNTAMKLEELSIRVYGEHVELFLALLKENVDTLKSLHVVYFESMSEPNGLAQKWIDQFGQLKKLEKVKIYASNMQIFEGTLECLEGLALRYLEVDCLRPVYSNIFQLLQSCAKTLEHLAFFNFYLPKHIVGAHTIGDCCHNLKKLILSYTRLLGEDDLCHIACNLVNLEVLVVRYSKYAVTNKSLTAIFKHMTQLRELDLSGNNDFNDDALIGTNYNPYPIHRLQRLEKLNLKSCPQLSTGDFLEALKFPFLRSLRIGPGLYTDSDIQLLVRQCPLLEELVVIYCPRVGRNALFSIAKCLPRLRVLHLLYCAKVDKSDKRILYDQCPLLMDLEISEKRTIVKTCAQ